VMEEEFWGPARTLHEIVDAASEQQMRAAAWEILAQ